MAVGAGICVDTQRVAVGDLVVRFRHSARLFIANAPLAKSEPLSRNV
jgi:hypothetical protein